MVLHTSIGDSTRTINPGAVVLWFDGAGLIETVVLRRFFLTGVVSRVFADSSSTKF